MRMHEDCLPCYLRQALRVARICSTLEEDHLAVTTAVSRLLQGLDMGQTPPANAIAVYDCIAAVTGCPDPYRDLKRLSNEQAMDMLPRIRQEIMVSPDPLASAIRFAIAGNSIDYGACATVDFEAALSRCRSTALVIDHLDLLLAQVRQLKIGSRILYLADNCGEIVYDRLVLERLQERGLDLTVAVRGGPIINDAALEDALACGLDRHARLISSGVACPGTSLEHCSDELLAYFHQADLVISKGQGNFETLSEIDREVFFLLLVKCRAAGLHLAELTGMDQRLLAGKGEMVVYCSPQR